MLPYFVTPLGDFPAFIAMTVIGILLFLLFVYCELKKNSGIDDEVLFIFPKITYSLLSACFFAGLFDSLFKISINNGFVIRGASFYGGLLGGIATMYVILFISKKKTHYSITEWFDILTLPLIIFHICGRIGCFLAGCCYGKTTKSILGVAFPDNPAADIFHFGERCYPTQLFEAIALCIIFIIVHKVNKRFKTYIILYGASRFIIEFFRGDDRGNFLFLLSPSQVVSLVLITIIVFGKISRSFISNKTKK